MFALDWRLAAFSLRAAAVLRLAHPPGRRRSASGSRPQRQGRAGRHVARSCEESLSASAASCSARRWAAATELAERFTRRVRASSPTSRSARAWPAAGGWPRCRCASRSCPRSSTGSPGSRSLGSRDLDRHAGRLHARCRRGCSSRSSRCCQRRRRHPDLAARCSTRIFEYLDLPVDIEERRAPDRARATSAATSRSTSVTFGYDADAAPTLRRRRPRGPGGHDDRDRGGDRLGQDDARLPRRAPLRRRRGQRDDRRRRRARAVVRVAGPHGRPRLAGDLPVPRHDRARTCASPGPRPPTRSSRTPPAPRRSTT